MKTAFVKAPYQFEIRETGLPVPQKHQALVKVMACAICGTDLHVAGSQAKDFIPFGHEIAGIVHKTGDDGGPVKAGDKVAIESSSFCGECGNCRNGRVVLCQNVKSVDCFGGGGFAEYVLVPQKNLVKFQGISFAATSLTEPLGVALDMCYLSEIQPGDDVLIIGPGPIGLMAARIARIMGAGKVYLAGRSHSKARLEAGKKLGIDSIICMDRTSVLEAVPRGVDKILLTASPSLIPEAVKAARFGGIISYIGIDYGPGRNFTLDGNEFHFKRLQLRASFAVPALFFPQALHLLIENKIDSSLIISHRFKLQDIAEAMHTAANDKAKVVKVVVEMNSGKEE